MRTRAIGGALHPYNPPLLSQISQNFRPVTFGNGKSRQVFVGILNERIYFHFIILTLLENSNFLSLPLLKLLSLDFVFHGLIEEIWLWLRDF